MRSAGRAVVVAAAAVAFALTLAYAAAVQPGWEPQHNDQLQYLSLARGLVERGEFTRARLDEPFIPETIRLPGYPLLLGPLCLGGCDRWTIAAFQGGLFAALVVAAHAIARRTVPARASLVAFAVAVYLPFAYYGALALSDLPGAALFALGVLAWLRATETNRLRWAFAAGALLGWTSLLRASLVAMPLVLGAIGLAVDRRLARVAAVSVLGLAVVVAPYVAYSEQAFSRPWGGNGGVVLWLGALQGRAEASLDAFERDQVAAARDEIASFDAMTDRVARALAWPALDAGLGARARALIAHDPTGWVLRAVPRSLELWAGDRPVPGGAPPLELAALLAAAQILVFAAGVAGAALLARRRVVLPLAVIAYVWLSAIMFQTEARYALPAWPFVIVGAVALFDRRRARHA